MDTHSLAQHFVTEAYNNAWANHRLLRACGHLTQEDFAAPRTSFFPSIKATLNHILTVDWYYLEIFERSLGGEPPHPDPHRHFRPPEPFESCADVSREQHRHRSAADRALRVAGRRPDGRCGADSAPHGRGARSGAPHPRAPLFEHDIHHRGQAHAMLAGTSVKPPPLDEFFCTGEADLREQDFAELGFDEETIWGARARI